MPDRTLVFACEPQPIVVEALRRILSDSDEFGFAGAAAALPEALDPVRRSRPHILLIDNSYGMDSIEPFVTSVLSSAPECRAVLWVAEREDPDWVRALQAGVRAVLLKTRPVGVLLQCLRSVAGGHVWVSDTLPGRRSVPQREVSERLTPREREVVEGVCRGLKNREIAAELGISAGTVKVHMTHLFEKTGAADRAELASMALRLLAPGDWP